MKKLLPVFLRNLVILTALVSAIAAGIYLMFPEMASPALPFLIPFFAVIGYVSFSVLFKASQGKFSNFTNSFMLITVVKLLVMLGLIALYLYLNRADAIRFVITLFLLYIVYTLFEVRWLLRLNRVVQAEMRQGK